MRFKIPFGSLLKSAVLVRQSSQVSGISYPFLLMFLCFFGTVYNSQSQSVAELHYDSVVRERSSKILAVIQFSNDHQKLQAQEILVQQYKQLNILQETIQSDSIRKFEQKKLHEDFLKQLNNTLNESQIEQVKDGMTYRVFPITMAAYEDMLPSLTQEQKAQIYNWLKEARELAMDEGSSNKKHAMFGKYKGRINNYLSAQGYDMKKESKDWEERVKLRKEQEKKNAIL